MAWATSSTPKSSPATSTNASASCAENALNRLRRVNMVTFDLARLAARNSRILRAKSLPAPSTLETLIATFAIEKGWTLLHDSPGYAPFVEHLGLKVVEVGE